MSSMRPVQSFKYVRLARAPLAAWLLAASAAVFGQAAPAVSTVFAFNGSAPNGGLVEGADGGLYGTSAASSLVSGGLIYRSTVNGSSVTTLHQLALTEGYVPKAGLLKGSDDLLYGSTRLGDQTVANTTGTTFSLAQDGTGFTILHRFAAWTTTNVYGSPNNADGAYPEAALIEGSDGFLYGVTSAGGTNGTGVIFRQPRQPVDNADFLVLHHFGRATSDPTSSVLKNEDGASPVGRLLEASDGYLYGTASSGGVNGRGTIFRVRMDGTGFEVVHTFTDLSGTSPATNVEGANPRSGLTDGQNGLLYGVTSAGGANGVGTLFSLDPNSGLLTEPVPHDFETANGAGPSGAPTLGLDGRLYGVTAGGGTSSSGTATNLGTIYSIARDGTGFTKLYSFDGTHGSTPAGSLLQLDATTFVGIAAGGGKCNQGTLYQYSSTGATVAGNTTCGQKKQNQSGGGSTAPGLLLLFGALGLARRRRRA
jgi:MYXO-CTERM domain-containing protein